MKKVIVLLAFMIAGLIQAQSISKHALGLRLGDNDGFGGEISYQRALGTSNRLEVDFGWRNSKETDAFKLMGLYQWIWNLDGNFNWYAGGGGGISFLNSENSTKNNLILAGNLGVEYGFDIPLLLSLDIRPEIYIGDRIGTRNFGPDIALGIRYQF